MQSSKAPNITVRRLSPQSRHPWRAALASVRSPKAAHITPSPFQGEGGDGGAMREHGHAHRHCTPTLALPLKGGGKKISTALTVEPLWVPRRSRGFTSS